MAKKFSYSEPGDAFPFSEPVRQGLHRFASWLIGIFTGSSILAMLFMGLLDWPWWGAYLLAGVGMGCALYFLAKAFIRWRIRLYGSAENTRQIHALMEASIGKFSPSLERLTTRLSTREEAVRWQSLLAQEQDSSQSSFPEKPTEAVSIAEGEKILSPLQGGVVVAAILVLMLLGPSRALFPVLGGAALLVWGFTLLKRNKRKPLPALVLSGKGLFLPKEDAFYPWEGVREEKVAVVGSGRTAHTVLQFRYRDEQRHKSEWVEKMIHSWKTTPGELRYLLRLYREAHNTNAGVSGEPKEA